MTELSSPLSASLADRYRIDRELGGGGMSRVFVAEELALGRRVVIKVLSPDLTAVISAARFEREVRVAARLQHPHIVPLLAAGQAVDALFYTMPLVDGESLRARLDQQGELSIGASIRIIREVADALAYAHEAGVIHRDIKPDNILLSHGHAMVTDFGIARALSESVGVATLTQTGMAVGTPSYMAPEQATADALLDHRADLYALGVVAYEMLAGHPPFRAATMQAMVAAHLTHDPPPLTKARPAVPAALADIVHRCLEKRPADRFSSARELLDALDRVTLSTSDSAQRTAHGISRRKALLGGGAIGLIGVGTGGAAWLNARNPERAAATYHRLTFRRGLVRTARFGPDSKTVLYGALWNGDVCRVYSVRPESPESAPLPLPEATPLAVSSSGELALALGSHFRGIMTYGTLARVPLAGGAPRALQNDVKYADWLPDGSALAVVRRVGDHDQLEFPAGGVVVQPAIATGGFSFVRVSPNGEAVAAFELEASTELLGRVVIIDRTGAKRTISARYFNVFGLAWHNDEVWFTAADALPLFRNTVYAMDRTGRVRVIERVPGNTSLHDIAPDGRVLIARTDDRSGVSVRILGESVERDLSWLDSTKLVDISRDGKTILFHEAGVGGGPRTSTYIRRTDGSMAVRLSDGIPFALSPDGTRALVKVDSKSAHFDVIPTGAGNAGRVERSELHLENARWLPNGTMLVVRATPRGARTAARLYAIDVDGTGSQAITPEGIAPGNTGWAVSPDGEHVAVSTGARVVLCSIDGQSSRDVPGDAASATVVGWINDGLLISDAPVDGGAVFLVNPDTGARTRWANLQATDPSGIMSLDLNTLLVTPDGRGYGYSWHRATSDLYVVEGWT